jgi:hypothetical protein
MFRFRREIESPSQRPDSIEPIAGLQLRQYPRALTHHFVKEFDAALIPVNPVYAHRAAQIGGDVIAFPTQQMKKLPRLSRQSANRRLDNQVFIIVIQPLVIENRAYHLGDWF